MAKTIVQHKILLATLAVTLLVAGVGLGLLVKDLDSFGGGFYNDNSVVMPTPEQMRDHSPPPADALQQMTIELPVDALPGSENEILESEPPALVVRIEAGGKVTFMGQLMNLDEFRKALCAERDYVKEMVLVTIIPRAETEYRSIREVMNVCEECSVPAYRVGRRNQKAQTVGAAVGI